MKKVILSLHILSLIFCKAVNGQITPFDAYSIKNDQLKKIDCPSEFSCGVYVSESEIKIGDNVYRKFLLPEDGGIKQPDKGLATYYRVQGNRVYYISDIYRFKHFPEVIFFEINNNLTKEYVLTDFYASGIANFKIQQVSVEYNAELKDTLHTYVISEYKNWVVDDYLLPLSVFTVTRKDLFQSFTYVSGKRKLILKRRKK